MRACTHTHTHTHTAQVAAGLSENFYRALQDDILVSEDEEGLWGLRGQPGTPEYLQVYR